MHGGLGVLRWPPDAFWRATPREIAAALRRPSASASRPLRQGELVELMTRFPDEDDR